MGTASECGTTTTSLVLPVTGGCRYPWWGVGGGYALTSSRSVVEGAPSHPYPTMGTASGCGTTTTSLVLPVTGGRRYPWWGDGWGVRSYVEPVRSRRCAQPPLPHHGYRIGVRYDGVVCRGGYPCAPGHPCPTMGTASGCGTTTTYLVLPVETGIYGGVTVGGYALTSSRSVVEGAPSHAYPTMDTASGCGTTVGGYRIGVRYDDNLPRLTGGNRYPWWGDGGGTLLRRAGP